MKKLLLIFALFFYGASLTMAQEDNPRADQGRLQAYKIAFLTKKLNLSPEEAQKFWPIYNNYESEIRSARVENRQKRGNEIETEERILNIRKRYNGEFGKALSTEKVNTLFRSEREFGTTVQRELMERRQRMDNRQQKRDN